VSGNEFERLSEETPGSPKDDAIVDLQNEIARLKEKRNEDRFCFLTALLIMADSYLFMHMPSWGGPIAILILEILILFVVARKMDIQDLTVISDKLIQALGGRNRGSGPS
jgi:hypothetical protein